LLLRLHAVWVTTRAAESVTISVDPPIPSGLFSISARSAANTHTGKRNAGTYNSSMSTSATIKLFLPYGDPKRLRTAEVSNWTGKALAAPRTEFDDLLRREELDRSGVYFLLGNHPNTGAPLAYIGEAEVIRERLRQHRSKEFWVSVVVFGSKDENLTKAHIRYLEARLMEESKAAGRYELENTNMTGAKLPESDREDMEVFLGRIRQVLPILGSDILTPIVGSYVPGSTEDLLYCINKGASATGRRTETGFVVFADSTAVLTERRSAATRSRYVVDLRKKLVSEGILSKVADWLVFTKDTEFNSPSQAASVIHGGSANGLTAWKDKNGRTLKQIEESETSEDRTQRQ